MIKNIFSNIKRPLIIILICIILTPIFKGITLVGSVFILPKLFGDTYSTKDINEYRNFDGHFEGELSGRYGKLDIFPETLPKSSVINKYYYYGSNADLFDNSYQIFLEYTLSKEDFEHELERLTNIQHTKDNSNFNYPAIVSKLNNNSTYEYVLYDKDTNKIVYVFLQFMTKTKIKFNKNYLPINWI